MVSLGERKGASHAHNKIGNTICTEQHLVKGVLLWIITNATQTGGDYTCHKKGTLRTPRAYTVDCKGVESRTRLITHRLGTIHTKNYKLTNSSIDGLRACNFQRSAVALILLLMQPPYGGALNALQALSAATAILV